MEVKNYGENGGQSPETHSVSKRRDNDLDRKFEGVVSRHIHVRVLVLVVEPKFGSQRGQGLLQIINKTFMEGEDFVRIPAEKPYVFLREYGSSERQIFVGFDAIACPKTFADSRRGLDR